MNKKVNDAFMSILEPYGALEWHRSKHNSYYIKFKDTRLGSIRIADHDGRKKYSYTHKVFTKDKTKEELKNKIETIIEKIIIKSKMIKDFNPNVYIVYDEKLKQYIKLENKQDYISHILKRNNNA
jgi:hypothetical protein